MARALSLRLVCIAIAAWLVLPVLVIVPLSFTDKASFVFPPTGYSTQWYVAFATDPDWLRVTRDTLVIALSSAVVAGVAGTGAALGLRGRSGLFRAALAGLICTPIIVPGVFLAIADYFVFLRLGLVGSYPGFIVADSVLALPLVFIPVTAALTTVDRRLELASLSLGASPWTTFRSVTLPLILPGVVSGMIFAFVSAWDEVLVGLFVSTPDMTTLPVRLYQSVSTTTDPILAAVATLTVAAIALGVGAMLGQRTLAGRRDRVQA